MVALMLAAVSSSRSSLIKGADYSQQQTISVLLPTSSSGQGEFYGGGNRVAGGSGKQMKVMRLTTSNELAHS